MTAEKKKDCFKAKLKDSALSSFKLCNENCKFESNFSPEEIHLLKALMGNKGIIQKASNLIPL